MISEQDNLAFRNKYQRTKKFI